MSQSSGYQYPPYAESNNPLKNDTLPIVNGQNFATQQNGMQSPQFNLTGKFLYMIYIMKNHFFYIQTCLTTDIFLFLFSLEQIYIFFIFWS